MIRSELEPPTNNTLNTYLPLRTKDKHYKFCWDTVLGYFVHALYDKSLVTTNVEHFKKLCKIRFTEILEEPDFWYVLEKMYFEDEQLYKISPELLIFKAVKGEIDTNSKKLGDMYLGLLCGYKVTDAPESQLNFLEKEIKAEFDAFYVTGKSKKDINSNAKEESPYLPFLTEKFQQDLLFLSQKSHYFLDNFDAFIRLYGFLYIAQMALNIKGWASGKPKSKPCFFIVDNEKASDERTQVKTFGYSQLHQYLEYLFPYLVMNETLQDKDHVKPLWLLFEGLNEEHLAALNKFGMDFIQDRNERKIYRTAKMWENASTTKEALTQLLDASFSQFEKKNGVYVKYNEAPVKQTLKTICAPFIQRRGRAGQVLTFNQDYIVLLTNLAIGGHRDKLRLHELIKEFEARGVFFDKQSQQGLIDFYERMGNVERMSDSGDAVYVRKTV
ncbi:DNA phosphorothioation-dependent restriction protein DptG [Shewanella frigidimarina]|uniref:DNA phosphorothioation-dependent restriction protein DptG n=1 Tax=Shewanella frigidimarina TaxID=56812 RepID=A0A106C2N8_SHEFR|nr:DNA phosphorothioation-dependent restriction protein DptG [Shewanella frigidimarina]KVX03118.1 DNA phosphorothioation-dependent restriction protein DptG [Shewanella frigidimarina]